jgi:tRNA threonylcarbamoyladenosine biosynthesis protein TsaB
MTLLALETATRAGSVALLDGEDLTELPFDPRGEGTVAAVNRILHDAGISPREIGAVAVSVGPGSFTGCRIGVSAAQGFCLATGVPAVPVGTLEGLAWSASTAPGAESGTLLLPSVDARRAEVYAALYRVVADSPPALLWGPEAISCVALARRFAESLPGGSEVAAGILSGDGAALLTPLFPEEAGWARPAALSRPEAAGIARAGRRRLADGGAVSPDELQPVYLRKSDAEIHREERQRPEG